MKLLVSLISSVFCVDYTFTNNFVDLLPFEESTLEVNNAFYTGKTVEYEGADIEIYRGIKYATADRWKAPIASVNTGETFSANTRPPGCLGTGILGVAEVDVPETLVAMIGMGMFSEDCLSMDIYKPANVENPPIVIFIHGGGFVFGDSSFYNGCKFAKEGVMAVLIQYRLDLFGFMNTFDYFGDKSIGGNYGLMDQQEAIKFVYDHAAEMGADQSKISLMGQSGGAMSVGMHLLNPESNKYFDTAISFSGSAMTGFMGNSIFQQSGNANLFWDRLCAKLVGCEQEESTHPGTHQRSDAYIAKLKNTSMEEIMLAKYQIDFAENILFGPISNDKVFWQEDAVEKLKSGDVPINKNYIISHNSWEGSLFGRMLPQFPPETFDFVQITWLQGIAGLPLSISEDLIAEYLGEMNKLSDFTVKRENMTPLQQFNIASHIIGDHFLRNGMLEEAAIYNDAGNTVYVMYNDFDANFDFTSMDFTCCGTSHAAELMYSVQQTPILKSMLKPWEHDMTNFMSAELASIVKNGVPSTSVWEQYDSSTKMNLHITNDENEILTIMDEIKVPAYSQAQIAFWKTLEVTEINECKTNEDDCDRHADCADLFIGFSCTCKTGYTGDGKTCVEEYTLPEETSALLLLDSHLLTSANCISTLQSDYDIKRMTFAEKKFAFFDRASRKFLAKYHHLKFVVEKRQRTTDSCKCLGNAAQVYADFFDNLNADQTPVKLKNRVLDQIKKVKGILNKKTDCEFVL